MGIEAAPHLSSENLGTSSNNKIRIIAFVNAYGYCAYRLYAEEGNDMKKFALLLMVVIGLAGCGSGTGGGTSVVPKTVATLVISDGDNQTGTVTTELASPLVAKVLDRDGKPIKNTVVNFVVTQGDGAVFAPAVTSDSDGFVRERWTLGTAGPQTVEVRAIDAQGNAVVFATFHATATAPPPPPPPLPLPPGPPATLEAYSGNSQNAERLHQLSDPLQVLVRDSNGTPVPGAAVTFNAQQGSVSPFEATTDVAGIASTTWILGPDMGFQVVTATIAGRTVNFSATATRTVPIPTAQHPYDGLYDCEELGNSFNVSISNGSSTVYEFSGVILTDHPVAFNLTESTGAVTGGGQISLGTRIEFSGGLTLGANGSASGGGIATFYDISAWAIPTTTGAWSCTRQ